VSEFVIITGLSGAGRSRAADTFEDLGWFVIDNLPPAMIAKVAELVQSPGSTTERVALVVGTNQYLDELEGALDELRTVARVVRVLFLEASDEVLVRRFEDTRRRHPLGGGEGVADAIAREREVLEAVKSAADLVVDTSGLNVHELRDRLHELFAGPGAGALAVGITSFGYKHGLPRDADVVLDCRFLANPHWVEDLRPLTGLDEAVRRYVLDQADARAFLDRLGGILDLLLPGFEREHKAFLTIGVGCTGGVHRSVVVAEALASELRRRGYEPTVSHRDLDRRPAPGAGGTP